MPPTPITVPGFGVRTHTAFHLEKKLVAFITQLFTNTYQLDNPAVNFLQPSQPELHDQPQPPPMPAPPVMPPQVPYDYTQRAQTLLGKVPPQVVRGRVPRTVTGEIDPSKLPSFPSICVQATHARIEKMETFVSVRIFVHAYDENPDSEGYQDVLNMMEVIALALTSYGQQGIDDAYVIVLPQEWKVSDAELFPHYYGEMHSEWLLPSARPLPDYDNVFPMVPAEHVDLKVEISPQVEVAI